MGKREILDGGLLLRSVEGERDVQAFALFNAACNNPGEGATCDRLLRHFPGIRHDCCWIIEEEQTGAIIATSCLIPWEVSFGGVILRAAMLEMVLSHPHYRRQGLIRKLISRFHEAAGAGQYDLCIITGIPYYYRQFGYSYCLDLGSHVSLPAHAIPAVDNDKRSMSLRRASMGDIPVLAHMHDRHMEDLEIHIPRDKALWRYMLDHAQYRVWIAEDSGNGEPAGYVMASGSANGDRLNIIESALFPAVAREVLCALAGLAPDGLTIDLLPGHLAAEAMKYGGERVRGGQWLMKLQAPEAMLWKLAGPFTRRLAKSAMAGFTGDFIINFYREALLLRFDEGSLRSVQNVGFVDSSMGASGGDLCIPPDAFIRLLFGYRTLDELWDAWPDIVAQDRSRQLVSILFPAIKARLFTPYPYQGSAWQEDDSKPEAASPLPNHR